MASLHERARALFLDALALPAGDRRLLLARECAGDEPLLREVESLLAVHDAEKTAEPFQPGMVFAGRYRMIARIGRGGMGDVWRADDLRTSRSRDQWRARSPSGSSSKRCSWDRSPALARTSCSLWRPSMRRQEM